MHRGPVFRAVLLVVAAVAALSIHAEDRWSRSFNWYGTDEFVESLARSCEGGLAATMPVTDKGPQLLRFDPSGNIVRRVFLSNRPNDGVPTLVPSPKGGYFGSGHTNDPGTGDDGWMLRLDDGLEILWQRAIGGPGTDRLYRAVGLPDGGAVFAGRTNSRGAGGFDVWAARVSGDGTVLWERTFGGPGEDRSIDVAIGVDGTVAILARTKSFGAQGSDFWLLELDASGTLLRERRIGGSADDTPWSVLPQADGGWILAGYTLSYGAGWTDLLMLRLSADGSLAWGRTLGGVNDEFLHGAVSQGTGTVVVARSDVECRGCDSTYLARIEADGSLAWQRRLQPQQGTVYSQPYALVTLADGDLVVGGWLADDLDAYLSRVGPTGPASDACDGAIASLASGSVAPAVTPTEATVTTSTSSTRAVSWADTGDWPTYERDECASGVPAEVSPALSPAPLVFLDDMTLAWELGERSGATQFDLYRGALSMLGASPGPDCFLAPLTVTQASDATFPPPGDGWYYLVAGRNAAGVGSLGVGAGCVPRSRGEPCPP